MATEHEVTPELMQQVVAQCKVVAHLAGELAKVHKELATIFASGDKGPEDIANIVGRDSASFMEALGEMLNGMDAVPEGSEWTDPIFDEAQRLWPASRESVAP